MTDGKVLGLLADISERMEGEFHRSRRVLSFDEYLGLVAEQPRRYCRDAAQYLRDAFDHFGTSVVTRPWGEFKRFGLFDLAFLPQDESRRSGLVGQEHVQAEVYRVLSNFVREGRANKVVLLHGPNGSAKSTVARCVMTALEHFSTLAEGVLYRFHWVFPTKASTKGTIGFGDKPGVSSTDSHAHLPESQIDARVFDEMRDHPLLLLPTPERRKLLEKLSSTSEENVHFSDWIWDGELSHKNKTVFDALLASYDGSLREVLRHVQVERYFISRRYRSGAVTVGPEMSVDARERQVTADRSLAALPTSLQAVALFEAHGELIEASGGVLEFSDLLKRPLDAFKYLQFSVETGEVALSSQNVRLNAVMLGSANEVELAAFRKHHEFESFRGRVELIPMAYLLSWIDEQKLYDEQLISRLRAPVVPHATRVAAMFAVLTRLSKPNPDAYPRDCRDLVRSLKAEEKLDLYGTGTVPERLDAEQAKRLRSLIGNLYQETQANVVYEGSLGASPREMRTVLLDAAQDPRYDGLSPFAVLAELKELCSRTAEYAWLQVNSTEGGFHDYGAFLTLLRARLLDWVEDELRQSSRLVDEDRYADLFHRYIHHVNHWAKKEKVLNPITGGYEEPDEQLMKEVEALLNLPDEPSVVRHTWINRVAAWAIDNPGQPIDHQAIFGSVVRRLRDAVFDSRRPAIANLGRNMVVVGRGDGSELSSKEQQAARDAFERFCAQWGYTKNAALDTLTVLVRERFQLTLG
jgi:serine protein kinase